MSTLDTLPLWLDLLLSALLLTGGAFALVGSWGLARLSDFLKRVHGPTKATTLGVGGILLGSVIYFSLHQGLSLHELLISLFLFITAPVSAFLIAHAALHRHCKSLVRPQEDAEVGRPDPEQR